MGGRRGETTAGSESMFGPLRGRTCTEEMVEEEGGKKKGGGKQHVDIAMQMKSPSHETQRLGLNLQTGKDKDSSTQTHTQAHAAVNAHIYAARKDTGFSFPFVSHSEKNIWRASVKS